MKPVLVLKQDVFTQIGPFQVPLSVGESSSNLRYQPGPDRLKPLESFITQSGELGFEPTKDKDAQPLAALGAPTTLSGRTLEEQRGWAQRAQARYDKKMPYQERLARGHAQRSSNTQQAFNEALRRTKRGARAGRFAAGALGGLAGLLALQRANESGTDLISALGSAGTQGYLTHQQLSPALQTAGMRASMIKRPPVGVSLPLRPPTSAGETQQAKLGDFEGFDTGAPTTQSVAPPTVAPPTTAQSLSSQEIVEAQNALGSGVSQHMAEPSHVSDEAMNEHKALTEEEEKMVQSTLGDFGKGNRRSFIGVR